MGLKVWILSYFLLGAVCSLVSGKVAEHALAKQQQDGISPTEPPLMRSTIKPTLAPRLAASPTKSVILNVPPKTHEQHDVQHVPAIATKINKNPEANLKKDSETKLPATTSTVTTKKLSSEINIDDTKPVKVTGFITKNGDIYEIEGKDGIGLIEGRQNAEEEKTNICNYGNVVIYSDVPCDEVTNIRVGDVMQTSLKEDNNEKEETQAQTPQPQSQAQPQPASENSPNEEAGDGQVDKPSPRPPRRRKGQKRVRPNKRNRRRRNNKKRRGSQANQNQVRRRKTQAQQKRKRQPANRRRRLQNQQGQAGARRRQSNKKNRNKRRPNRRNRNRNKNRQGNRNRNSSRRWNQRLQQAKRRQQEHTRGRMNEYYILSQ